MRQANSHPYSRRSFIYTSLLGMAGVSLIPLNSCVKPSDIISIGFIGLGRQAVYLLDSFIKIEGVRVLAGADVYGIKRDRFVIRTQKHYDELGISQKVDVYEDYRKILDRKDIDVVAICSPDHWHAIMAIDACKAGKDIYLEKPVTFTIKEGQELVKAVRSHNRILAVGSQQRSDNNFKYVNKLVQDGEIGTLEKVFAYVGNPPHPGPYNLPEEPVPASLNWKKWLGPLPDYHFNKELNPPVSIDPPINETIWGAWRWFREFGGGFMTDWGAHMIDIAQWGIGYEKSGPVRIIPAGYDGAEFLMYKYDNGLSLSIQPFGDGKQGVKFFGSKGWIEVGRDYFNTSMQELKPVSVNDNLPYEGRAVHHIDFFEALRTRKDPAVPIEIGHKTCVTCTLGNIAHELGRPLEWNPDNESFVNDTEADKYLHYDYRDGYSL